MRLHHLSQVLGLLLTQLYSVGGLGSSHHFHLPPAVYPISLRLVNHGTFYESLYLERFAAVGAELRKRHGGTVVILGESEEYAAGEYVAEQVGEPCRNLVGRTSLVVLGAVIAHLTVLVTNDSGPAHMAYALGTPTVTVFGAGNPATNGPLQRGPFRALAYEVSCRPCGYSTCPIGYVCLEGVTVRQVVETSQEVMRVR